MDTMCADEQDVFTKVNADLEQVACETCVKDNTAMVAKVGDLSSTSQHAPAAHIRTCRTRRERRRRWKGEKEKRKAR